MSAKVISIGQRRKTQARRSATHVAILIRMERALLVKLDRAARVGWRSRTAEVNWRLDSSLANESIDEHGVIVVHPAARGK